MAVLLPSWILLLPCLSIARVREEVRLHAIDFHDVSVCLSAFKTRAQAEDGQPLQTSKKLGWTMDMYEVFQRSTEAASHRPTNLCANTMYTAACLIWVMRTPQQGSNVSQSRAGGSYDSPPTILHQHHGRIVEQCCCIDSETVAGPSAVCGRSVICRSSSSYGQESTCSFFSSVCEQDTVQTRKSLESSKGRQLR